MLNPATKTRRHEEVRNDYWGVRFYIALSRMFTTNGENIYDFPSYIRPPIRDHRKIVFLRAFVSSR